MGTRMWRWCGSAANNKNAQRPTATCALLLLGLAFSLGAQAGLGERLHLVQQEAGPPATGWCAAPVGGYAIHERTTEHGTRVRQYVSRDGIVFAAAWSGPALPDPKALLGTGYAHYQAAVHVQAASRSVLAIESDALVLRIVRLPRGLAGSAHIPALLPQGVAIDVLANKGWP